MLPNGGKPKAQVRAELSPPVFLLSVYLNNLLQAELPKLCRIIPVPGTGANSSYCQ
jgi:hypothetical protein